ncbi:MAG: xanthine phosphoribosyltransferase [Clostridia bacterium]|nr:xanthine phosphoribosyltransferase [Clostridia bacterium]
MKLLEDRILKDGTVLPGNVLKVDSFLNHQIDYRLVKALGEEFYNTFKAAGVTKILTVEASGIAIACAAAEHFNVPVVFAKKGHHKNVGNDVYTADVFSFTKGITSTVSVSKKYLNEQDKVLVIDDFLADGQACLGLKSICEQAGAQVVGFGIAIEKGFQNGGKILRETGIPVQSLAIIASMTDDSICFASSDR